MAWKNTRFDRNEISGAFGDIGTDLPLIAGMILTCRLDTASTLIPILGVVLLLEGLTLMSFVGKVAHSKADLFVSFLVAVMTVGLPRGYLVGMIAGT